MALPICLCGTRLCIVFYTKPIIVQEIDWCIYPMYDWTHGQSDYIEASFTLLCSLEFKPHRDLYDWFLDALNHLQIAAQTARICPDEFVLYRYE